MHPLTPNKGDSFLYGDLSGLFFTQDDAGGCGGGGGSVVVGDGGGGALRTFDQLLLQETKLTYFHYQPNLTAETKKLQSFFSCHPASNGLAHGERIEVFISFCIQTQGPPPGHGALLRRRNCMTVYYDLNSH